MKKRWILLAVAGLLALFCFGAAAYENEDWYQGQRGETLDEREKADIAASFTGALIYTIVTRLEKLLCEKEKLPVVLAGGVAANSHLRRAVCDLCAGMGVECFIPPLSLCGDNAAMIASQGYYEFLAGVRAPLDQNAFATLGV